ncbi:MAG TPA: hypothetical protein VGK73_36250 [Polyangiaceae bacterium]
MGDQHGGIAAILRLLADVEGLLKQPGVGHELGRRGINSSLALTAAQGLSSYVNGNPRRAHEDFATVAEEIRTRLDLPR